jgi:hypothetical protein
VVSRVHSDLDLRWLSDHLSVRSETGLGFRPFLLLFVVFRNGRKIEKPQRLDPEYLD